jgi:hypothetical protein
LPGDRARSVAAGELDLGRVGVGAVEHDGVSHDAAEGGLGRVRELARHGLFVAGLAQADLDQLVVRQGGGDRLLDRRAHAPLADEHDRLERMGEAAQIAALGAVEHGGGPGGPGGGVGALGGFVGGHGLLRGRGAVGGRVGRLAGSGKGRTVAQTGLGRTRVGAVGEIPKARAAGAQGGVRADR